MKKIINKISTKFLIGALITTGSLGFAGVVNAATTTVNLGTAGSFAILAGAGITNVPTSVIKGDVGLSPITGALITGLTTADVTGTIFAVDSAGPAGAAGNNPNLLTTAKNDLTAAFTDASGRSSATPLTGGDNQLGGKTLTPGVYSFSHATTANLIGSLTLSGDGIFIFQAASDFRTASASSVVLTNGAQACNVFWTVPSSVSGQGLGTGSTMVGTIMADQSITLETGATLNGRALARIAAVTMDNNTITVPTTCTNPVVAPTLPNTGFAPTNNGAILWAATVSLSALASFVIIRKKRII
ncbi:MAG: ice-binding family protein [Candidatus Saccharibacteria bacterium]